MFDVPSGEEALALVAATGLVPDRCLIDYQLGAGMSGLDCLAALRARLGPVSALIVTADRSEALGAEARALGGAVLQKPIPTEALSEFLFGAGSGGAAATP
ncbi:hypothetical protein ACTTAM_10125 [Rhodobacter capsulatus]|uniref:hypothetical protein n=1 Tax=Rhodobacter capsulatus TaxID=1061 RepID=UPI004026E65C